MRGVLGMAVHFYGNVPSRRNSMSERGKRGRNLGEGQRLKEEEFGGRREERRRRERKRSLKNKPVVDHVPLCCCLQLCAGNSVRKEGAEYKGRKRH